MKLDVVPKPYQKPHPKLFQAFSLSEATIRWCAKEDIVPMILTPQSDAFRHLVHAYQEESLKYGRKLERGKSVGVLRQFTIGNDQEVHDLCENGAMGMLWKRFWGHFGFWDAFKTPEEQSSGKPLTPDQWTVDRMRKFHYVYAGSVKEVRKGMDALVEAGNPEYLAWLSDQGMLPLDEVINRSDLLILCAPHSAYRQLDLAGKPVVDVWGFFQNANVIS